MTGDLSTNKMAAVSQTALSNAFFLNENVWITMKNSLKFAPNGPVNNTPAFVQITAWRRSGDKPIFESIMVSLLTQIRVTKPLWFNKVLYFKDWIDEKDTMVSITSYKTTTAKVKHRHSDYAIHLTKNKLVLVSIWYNAHVMFLLQIAGHKIPNWHAT